MSYSCLEELQVDLDLHALDKISVLSKTGCKYKNGWLVVTSDGICHLFDKDGNLDDIKKITRLEPKHIRRDIIKIVIPDSVMSIGKAAFYYYSDLTSVTIPNSVMNIEYEAFSGCKNLTNVIIPNSMTSIGENAFTFCSGLISVTIPNSVINIGDFAFYSCSSLMSVTIPDSVTSIGFEAFHKCDTLVNLTFKGKTLEQVRKMKGYPWGIEDKLIINVE